MNDVSVSKSTRHPELGPSNARTPDNNDVPISRESAGRSGVELGDSLKPNSFLQSSDSLDNNCILNGESVGADLDVDLDRFEGATVARFREELFLSQKPLKETDLQAIASAVSSAKFQDERKSHVNRRESKSYAGYYSEYFDVHKPVYNKRLVEANSRMVEVPRRESAEENEPVTPSSTDTWRKSFRKKEISKLISYFETEVAKSDRSPENSLDFKSKIFEEVSAVRDKERRKVSKRSSGTVHPSPGRSPQNSHSKSPVPKISPRFHISGKAYQDLKHRSYVALKSTGWRSFDHHETDCSPSSDNFEPDSLEPMRRLSVTSGSTDWQSSKSQDSDCSSCTDSAGAVHVGPSLAEVPRKGQRPSSGRNTEVGSIPLENHNSLHCAPMYGRSVGPKTDHGPSKHDTVFDPHVEASRHFVRTGKVGSPARETVGHKLPTNRVDSHTFLTKAVESPVWTPSNPRHISYGKDLPVDTNPAGSGQLERQTSDPMQHGLLSHSGTAASPQPKPRKNRPTPESLGRSLVEPTDALAGVHQRTAAMQLELLTPGDHSADASPNIITPPIGFQNVFPLEARSDEKLDAPLLLKDAELFSHISVKNILYKWSSQDQGWLVHLFKNFANSTFSALILPGSIVFLSQPLLEFPQLRL